MNTCMDFIYTAFSDELPYKLPYNSGDFDLGSCMSFAAAKAGEADVNYDSTNSDSTQAKSLYAEIRCEVNLSRWQQKSRAWFYCKPDRLYSTKHLIALIKQDKTQMTKITNISTRTVLEREKLPMLSENEGNNYLCGKSFRAL